MTKYNKTKLFPKKKQDEIVFEKDKNVIFFMLKNKNNTFESIGLSDNDFF